MFRRIANAVVINTITRKGEEPHSNTSVGMIADAGSTSEI
jgi:hypothetical protein